MNLAIWSVMNLLRHLIDSGCLTHSGKHRSASESRTMLMAGKEKCCGVFNSLTIG
jgi:hypothetical protein